MKKMIDNQFGIALVKVLVLGSVASALIGYQMIRVFDQSKLVNRSEKKEKEHLSLTSSASVITGLFRDSPVLVPEPYIIVESSETRTLEIMTSNPVDGNWSFDGTRPLEIDITLPGNIDSQKLGPYKFTVSQFITDPSKPFKVTEVIGDMSNSKNSETTTIKFPFEADSLLKSLEPSCEINFKSGSYANNKIPYEEEVELKFTASGLNSVKPEIYATSQGNDFQDNTITYTYVSGFPRELRTVTQGRQTALISTVKVKLAMPCCCGRIYDDGRGCEPFVNFVGQVQSVDGVVKKCSFNITGNTETLASSWRGGVGSCSEFPHGTFGYTGSYDDLRNFANTDKYKEIDWLIARKNWVPVYKKGFGVIVLGKDDDNKERDDLTHMRFSDDRSHIYEKVEYKSFYKQNTEGVDVLDYQKWVSHEKSMYDGIEKDIPIWRHCRGKSGCNGKNCGTRDILGCFAQGTLIAVDKNTYKTVESLNNGDYVWNPIRKTKVKIFGLIAGPEESDLIEIHTQFGKIRVTKDHPMVLSNGFIVAAENIKIGDSLLSNNTHRDVLKVSYISSDKVDKPTVWNFALDSKSSKWEDHVVQVQGGIYSGDLFLQKRIKGGISEK